jgi:hypothetical protein
VGGTAPYCPFCRKLLVNLKAHIKAKHPERYQEWLDLGRPPYWRYDMEGNVR